MPKKAEPVKQSKPAMPIKPATPVTQSNKTEVKKVNWVLVLVLSIVVGHLGVDRFIIGHIWQGILKLITFGGLGVWWIIDIILIATKHKFKNIEWVTN